MLKKNKIIEGQYNDTIGESVWDSFRGLTQMVFNRFEKIGNPKFKNTHCTFIEQLFLFRDFYYQFKVPKQFIVENELALKTMDGMDDETFAKYLYDGIDTFSEEQELYLNWWKNELSLEYNSIEPQLKTSWTTTPEFQEYGDPDISLHENGSVGARVFHYEKSPDSLIINYNAEGRKILEEYYSEEELHGYSIYYYPNGKKEFELLYYKGVLVGKSTYWHPNGSLQSEGTWLHGKRRGEWSYYDYDGQLEFLVTWE
jgi:antitoxin component YwqK of YwqJK toxin-antitoxin module